MAVVSPLGGTIKNVMVWPPGALGTRPATGGNFGEFSILGGNFNGVLDHQNATFVNSLGLNMHVLDLRNLDIELDF